jgi:DNA uptake protein ComE-like DNA-binding protein
MKVDRLHWTLGLLLVLGIGFRAMRERAPARHESGPVVSALDRQIDDVGLRRKAGKHKPPPGSKRASAGRLPLPRPEEATSLRVESTPVGARAEAEARAGTVTNRGTPRLLVNVDVASAASIESLPRIGPALAQRIVDDRAVNGPFSSLAGLDRVKGIGPALQKLIAPHVTFAPEGRPSTVATIPQPEKASGRGKGRRRSPASVVR